MGDQTTPCVYGLLESKSTEAYEEFLRAVDNACAKLGHQPHVEEVVTDFEIAAMKAVRRVFGADVKTRGCFFHFCQNTYRKIQELGLVKLYQSDNNFKQFCGMLDGLAFLPLDKIDEGVNVLKVNMPPEAGDLVNYFISTYTCSKIITAGGVVRKQKPTFRPDIWNINEVTKAGGERTNNYSEGWNNHFRSFIGHQHPSIWRLIDALQADEAASHTKIVQFTVGNLAHKKTNKVSKKLQERLSRLCSELDSGKRSVEQFLKAIGHTIRYK